MKYFVQGKEVNKEEFYSDFEKALERYKPISEYWPQTKEEVYKTLKEEREFSFSIKGNWKCFVAIEEEICSMVQIINEIEYDACDNNSVAIAVALYNAGYGKVK